MTAAKLPREEILQWLAEGKTQMRIVELLRRRGIATTQPAISRIKVTYGDTGRHDVPMGYPRSRFIPWRLKDEHRRRYAAQMLRAYTRRQDGKPLKDYQDRQLDRWLAGLAADDAVIHYEPETDEGFFRVPRRKGIDLGLVREPDEVE